MRKREKQHLTGPSFPQPCEHKQWASQDVRQ
jgi:hypothetical protein